MNDRYRVYDIVTERDKSPDGAKLEWTRGCNGERHVDHLDEVSYEKDGVVKFVEELNTVEQGPCDKSCGTKRRGGFIYPKR